MYPHRVAMARMITGRTQWVVLSAPSDHPSNGYTMWVHGSMLHTLHDHAIVVVVDKLEGSGRRVTSRTSNWRSHPSCMVPSRWPEPSEGSAVLTELRLGRVARDTRVHYLRFCAICIVNV